MILSLSAHPATFTLPAMVDRAARALASANTAAEVLEARDIAGVVYDAAKRAARFAKIKGAHDDVIAKTHRAQADALEIEAGAKRRLADEYDAAQERGEVVGRSGGGRQHRSRPERCATVAEVGLTRKDIHDARLIRDAENAQPGIVKRAIDAAMAAGKEPTRALVKRATKQAVPPIARPAVAKRKRRKATGTFVPESQHDSDLRMLRGVWVGACDSARSAFREEINREGE